MPRDQSADDQSKSHYESADETVAGASPAALNDSGTNIDAVAAAGAARDDATDAAEAGPEVVVQAPTEDDSISDILEPSPRDHVTVEHNISGATSELLAGTQIKVFCLMFCNCD